MVATRTLVASVVTTMKISSFTRSLVVRLSRRAISAAPPPRTVRTAGRPDPESSAPEARRYSRSQRRVLRAGVVGETGVLLGVLGGHAGGALAGGLVDAVVEVGLLGHRVGLAPGRVGQVQAVGTAVVNELRVVLGAVGVRLAGQRLQDDVEHEATERLGLELAGLHDALQEARELRGVAGQHPELGALTSPSRTRLSPFWSRKVRAVSQNDATSVNSAWSSAPGLEGAGRGDRVVQDLRDLGEDVGVGAGDLRREPQVLDSAGIWGLSRLR